MKLYYTFCAYTMLISIQTVVAQNVGIGTNTPQSRLHIIDGSSGYSGSYFSGLTLEGSGNRYANLIVPSSFESGILFGRPLDAAHGGIIYNNSSTAAGLQFRTNGNNTRMVIDQNGNVGIGTTSPGFPLSFSNSIGDKIGLWGSSGAHYGIGIQSLLLQIHTDIPSADIAFGYGSSAVFTENLRIKGNGILQFPPSLAKKIVLYPGGTGDASFGVFGNELRIASDYSGANITMGYDDRSLGFTERMRVMGNGNVGIGVTDPSFKLDISDRMRIRSGGGFSSAGLYLNNNNNTASPAFIGMDDDTHVGFWGSGVGWRFTMNTQTGALKVNGSEGQAGQVLSSTGGGGNAWVNQKAPSFYSFAQNDYQLTIRRDNNSPGEAVGWHIVGGMHNQTITLTATSSVIMDVRVPLNNPGNTFGGVGVSEIYLGMYDASNNYISFGTGTLDVANGMTGHAIASGVMTLQPGTYRTHVKIFRYYDEEMAMGQYYIGADHGRLIVQVFPQ
jgi:hypothetical protein